MTKRELAIIRATQMKAERAEIDIEKTAAILMKGMSSKELEKAIKA